MSCVASGTVDTVVWSVHVQVVVEVVRSQSSYHLCKRFTQKRLAIIWCDSYAMSRLEKAKKWKGIEHMKTPPKRLEVAVPETILVPQQSLSKRQKISSCIPRTFCNLLVARSVVNWYMTQRKTEKREPYRKTITTE
jgi:hypothetical protein